MLAVGLVVGWLVQSADTEVASIGSEAPEFTVDLFEGGTFTYPSDLAQGPKTLLVLNLWASWCVPCRTETPDISRFALANPEVTVLGVAVEDTFANATVFFEEFRPSYVLGFGNPQFEAAYPRLGLPVTYIIDADGIVTDVVNGIVNSELLESLVSS